MDPDSEYSYEGASVWTWLGLSSVAVASFWFQAVITEERFVPALNMISIEHSIPDDVAGATLMAAGASSPEFFSSMVSLFVTHSSLGLGTIVGSEIFNQLIICAGAVWASRSGSLKLDPVVLFREVGFYALSILLLYVALWQNQDNEVIIEDIDEDINEDLNEVDMNEEVISEEDISEDKYLRITFWGSAMLFGAYIVYVWVCVKMNYFVALVKKYSSIGTSVCQNDLTGDDSAHEVELQSPYSSSVNLSDIHDTTFFVHEKWSSEPEMNFQGLESNQPSSSSRSFITRSLLVAVTAAEDQLPESSGLRSLENVLSREKPSDLHGLFDLEVDETNGSVSFFMWQRSIFYSEAHCGKHTWELRWFTINDKEFKSVPDRTQADYHGIVYPAFHEIEVDTHRMMLRILHGNDRKHDFFLMAPSPSILNYAVKKLEDLCQKNNDHTNEEEHIPGSSHTSMPFESLIAFPVGGSSLAIMTFCFTYPLRVLIHCTVPDVRVHDLQGNVVSRKKIGILSSSHIAALTCLFWIIAGSYAMCTSLEALAHLMHIPEAVVGATVSAVGTSLPNYVASKVAAEKGFGNMAVSNAFGSNTFNIMVGLGLPWLLYTTFTGFRPYYGIKDEGIGESVLIMALVLLLFIGLVIPSGFVLYKWHALLFLATYIGYLAYVITSVL